MLVVLLYRITPISRLALRKVSPSHTSPTFSPRFESEIKPRICTDDACLKSPLLPRTVQSCFALRDHFSSIETKVGISSLHQKTSCSALEDAAAPNPRLSSNLVQNPIRRLATHTKVNEEVGISSVFVSLSGTSPIRQHQKAFSARKGSADFLELEKVVEAAIK